MNKNYFVFLTWSIQEEETRHDWLNQNVRLFLIG